MFLHADIGCLNLKFVFTTITKTQKFCSHTSLLVLIKNTSNIHIANLLTCLSHVFTNPDSTNIQFADTIC